MCCSMILRYFSKSRSWRQFYSPRSKIVISHTPTLNMFKVGIKQKSLVLQIKRTKKNVQRCIESQKNPQEMTLCFRHISSVGFLSLSGMDLYRRSLFNATRKKDTFLYWKSDNLHCKTQMNILHLPEEWDMSLVKRELSTSYSTVFELPQ